MSRIYQFEEIGYTPGDPECFEQGIGIAANGFQRLVGDGHLEGVLLYGSAVFGDANARSDIDALVVLKTLDTPTLQALNGLFRAVKEQATVPLGMTAFTAEDLRAGRHTLRDGMLGWLDLQGELFPEYVIGKNPLDFVKPLEQELLRDVDLYLSERQQVMATSFIHGHDLKPEAMLEMALNTPHKCGRKAIDALVHKKLLPAETLPDMRKVTVANAVSRTFGIHDTAIHDLQDDLRRDFTAYSRLVDEVKAGHINRGEYWQLIYAVLHADLPKAIDLTRCIQLQFQTRAGLM